MTLHQRVFLAHPHSIGETYWQHYRISMEFCGRLAWAAFAAYVHAHVPCLFVTTASSTVGRLMATMNKRKKSDV